MRILVADDSPVIRAAVRDLLTSQGYEVHMAEDGVEAVQKFYEDPPDLVLLDLQMPGLNGYVACRMIKEDWTVAHIPVLILTARRTAEDRYWAEKSGADGYITKDELGSELLAAIRTASASLALSELTHDPARVKLDHTDVLTKVCEMLDHKLFEMSIVNDIVTLSTRTLDLRTTMRETLFIVRRFVEFEIGGLALLHNRVLEVRPTVGVARDEVEQFRTLSAGHLEQLSGQRVAPDDLTLWLEEDGEGRLDPEQIGQGLNSFFAMALRSRGDVTGVLCIAARRPGVYTPAVVRTTRMVESPISMVIDSATHHQKQLEEEARQSLSSLYDLG